MCYGYAKQVRALSGGGSLMRTITLDVGGGGLSRASCAAGLEMAVSHVPGMERLTFDLAMERVAVTFDTDATSVQAIAKAIFGRACAGRQA
jgi:cation transport ATPase